MAWNQLRGVCSRIPMAEWRCQFLNGNLVAKMVQTLPNKQEPTASCHQNPLIKVMQGFLRHEDLIDLYKCQSMSGWSDTFASWVRGSKKLHCRWSTAPDRSQISMSLDSHFSVPCVSIVRVFLMFPSEIISLPWQPSVSLIYKKDPITRAIILPTLTIQLL